MGFDFILIAVVCGFTIWFCHSKVSKWYWKTLIFIAVLLAGWFLITALGFYVGGDNGMLKYLTRSPLYLITGCSIGAWKARKLKTQKANKTAVKWQLPKVKIQINTPIKRLGFIVTFTAFIIFTCLYVFTDTCKAYDLMLKSRKNYMSLLDCIEKSHFMNFLVIIFLVGSASIAGLTDKLISWVKTGATSEKEND